MHERVHVFKQFVFICRHNDLVAYFKVLELVNTILIISSLISISAHKSIKNNTHTNFQVLYP
jgi:hypothetical protein